MPLPDVIQACRKCRISFGTKAVGARQKVRLEDRLDHQLDGHLYHPVPDDGYSQGAFLRFAGLVDPHPLDRLRTVLLGSERLLDVEQEFVHPNLVLNLDKALLVDPRCTLVGTHPSPGLQ